MLIYLFKLIYMIKYIIIKFNKIKVEVKEHIPPAIAITS